MQKTLQTPGGMETHIRTRMPELTAGQRVLAEWVLMRPDEVAFMSTLELAAAAGTSDAAVVRFAQALGYEGFPELRAKLRRQMLERSGASAVQKRTGPIKIDASLPDRVFELDQETLAVTRRANTWEKFGAVIDAICSAERVFVVGHGTSHGPAHYLSVELNQALGRAYHLAAGGGDMFDRLATLTSKDLVLVISFTRYLKWSGQALEAAAARGAKTVLITDSLTSAIAGHARHVLLAPSSSVSFTWSQAGLTWILNVLITGVVGRSGEGAARQLAALDELLARFDLLYDRRPRLRTHGTAHPRRRRPSAAVRSRKVGGGPAE